VVVGGLLLLGGCVAVVAIGIDQSIKDAEKSTRRRHKCTHRRSELGPRNDGRLAAGGAGVQRARA
jgi:hypothetical protein